MKLARLRIAGFKSFVEPVETTIEAGLTGVVGPNGCGKSNLLEALRWVMGASSAKAMRAGGMDDVIFAGTDQRPARNHAEVALVLDNRDRLAPDMFNDADELEVARRITRGGGSTYRVNGREVRARDVQLLFADASTGANSPALVRQGQIAELIAAKPQNRRLVLEEAAGVSGLRSRRHEGELKLRAAQTNLERLDDSLGDVGRQLEALRRQARQARRYRTLSGQITDLERRVCALLWAEARDALTASTQEAQGLETQLVACQAEVARTSSASERAEQSLPGVREEEAVAVAIEARALAARDAAVAARDEALRLVAAAQARPAEIEAEAQREQALLDDAASAMSQLQADQANAPAPPSDAALAQLAADKDRAESGRDAAETALSSQAEALAEARGAARAAQAQSRALAERRARLVARQDALTPVDALITAQDEADRAARASQQAHVADIEAVRVALADAQARDADLEAAQSAFAHAQDGERRALAAVEARDAAILALEAALAATGFDGTGDEVGDQPSKSQGARVIDVLTLEAGLERAVAAALGDAAHAVVSDDLSATTGARATAHPQSWSTASKAAVVTRAAAANMTVAGAPTLLSRVEAPKALWARLARVGVVETTEEGDRRAADLAPGERLVTLQGAVWRWDGYRQADNAPSPAAQRLAARARLSEEQAAALPERAALAKASRARQAAQAALDAAQSKAETARAALSQARAGEDTSRRAAAAAEDARLAAEARLARGRDEAEALDAEAVALEEAGGADTDTQAPSDDDLAALQVKLDGARQDAAVAREAAADARAALDAARDARATAEARAAARARDLDAWRARAERAKTQLTACQVRLVTAQGAAKEAASAPQERAELAERAQTAAQAAQARAAKAKDARAEAEAAANLARQAAREAEAALSDAREARAGVLARQESDRTRQDEAEARLVSRCALAPSGLSEEDMRPGDADAEARKLERLRAEREGLGGVNLAAEDEINAIESQRADLMRERADLEEAIATLRRGVNALNKTARERVDAAFIEIDGHFRRLFEALFDGGEAALALVDSDDPLEAGLDIQVSPPGKRLGSMSLLSGGEQALTATALIFAVFLANPAPVCALDEVDAPLDDANVDRFCRLLDAMRRDTDTRFLIITHNPVTMARMDRLYGVTMAERGVSQLVSVDLSQAEQLIAAE